jgi:uncharacterized membrane protein YcaP (DUF421 family)
MATLTTIGNVASAMGQAVEKSSKVSEICLAFVFIFQLLMLHFLFSKFNFFEWFIAGHSVGYIEMSWGQ